MSDCQGPNTMDRILISRFDIGTDLGSIPFEQVPFLTLLEVPVRQLM